MPNHPNKHKPSVTVNPATLPHIQTEKYTEFYCNHSETSMSPWDCRIKFSQLKDQGNGKIAIEDQAIATMSLHHAKALAVALTQSIAQYEQANGNLSIPTTVQKVEDDMKNNPEPAAQS